jgi:hypothetical protein
VQVVWFRSQTQVETIDNTIGSRQHNSTEFRCVCLPDRETARILLELFLEKTGPILNFPHTYMLKDVLESTYAQMSRAEVPDLILISLFLSSFTTGAQYGMTDDKTTLCSRYWQMTALSVLAEQRRASLLRLVDELQNIVNILPLMQYQQGSYWTFHSLHALGVSLDSKTPT